MRGSASKASRAGLSRLRDNARRAMAGKRLPAERQPRAFLVAVGLEEDKAVSPTPVEDDEEDENEEEA